MPKDAGHVSCSRCALTCAAEFDLSTLWRNRKILVIINIIIIKAKTSLGKRGLRSLLHRKGVPQKGTLNRPTHTVLSDNPTKLKEIFHFE